MRILNIKQSYVNNTNLNNSSIYYNLTFKSVKKINPQDAFKNNNNSLALYQKISSLFKRFPSGTKMMKPLLINLDGEGYAISLDKTTRGLNKIIVKDSITNLDEWKNIKSEQTVLSAIFDNDGNMTSGEIIKPTKLGYNQNAHFQRNDSTHRRLQIEGIVYKPSSGSDTIWSSIPAYSYGGIIKDIDINNYLKNNCLANIFFEFTKGKKAITL